MKKLFYVLMIALVTSLSVSSCTEEEVVPASDSPATGSETTNEIRKG